MCQCDYINCIEKATKKVIVEELEQISGKGKGTGLFCDKHANEMISSSADTIVDLKE